jgi:hypothetical protein
MVVGTAEYMSPEQVRGEVVDGRSDVFSAGAMLYELVRGSRPFHADGIMAIFYKITHEDPAFDFPFTPEYRALIPILGKALAKDAAARYQSASEFADALRPFIMAPGMRPTAVVVPLPAVPAAPIPARVQEEVPPTSALPPPVPAIIDDRRTIVDPSPLFQLIRDIYVGGRTGHLHFTRAKEWRSLRFLKGQILHATSDVEGEHLGDVLVRYGLLTQDDLEKARTVVLAERKKLGTVLDSMGLMPKGELESSIKLHVREVLFNVTEMPDMKFSFEELGEDSFLETELQSRVAPGEMILEAARRIQEPAVVTAVLGNIDRVIAPASHPVLGAQKLTLTPTDGFVLSRVDGTLTAREVFHLTPLPAEDTERSLFALLCTGAVEYRAPVPRPRTGVRIAEPASSPGTASHKAPPTGPPPPAPAPPPPAPAAAPANAPATPPAAAATPSPPPAPKTDAAPSEAGRRAMADARRREIQELHDGMRSKDHFEILGISRSATADEVKDAYFRLARPYHPDASLDPSLEDLRDKRSAVFIRLGRGLRDPPQPDVAEALRDRVPAAPRRPPARAFRGRGASAPAARSRARREDGGAGLREGAAPHGRGEVLGRHPAPRRSDSEAGGDCGPPRARDARARVHEEPEVAAPRGRGAGRGGARGAGRARALSRAGRAVPRSPASRPRGRHVPQGAPALAAQRGSAQRAPGHRCGRPAARRRQRIGQQGSQALRPRLRSAEGERTRPLGFLPAVQ